MSLINSSAIDKTLFGEYNHNLDGMENMELWAKMYYEGKYTGKLVSNFGNAKKDDGTVLDLVDNGAGYFSVAICSWKDGKMWKSKRDYIHRVVAQYFIENPLNLPQVNHKDCDKTNNRAENLEWTTRSANIDHAHAMGRMKVRSALTEINVLTVAQVIELYTSVKRDGVGVSVKAREMGLPRTTASSIMNKRSRGPITNELDNFILNFPNSQGYPSLADLKITDVKRRRATTNKEPK